MLVIISKERLNQGKLNLPHTLIGPYFAGLLSFYNFKQDMLGIEEK